MLQFTITPAGRVRDVVVIEGRPPGVFERVFESGFEPVAIQTRIEDGEPVEVRGMQTQFAFQLDD